MSAQSVLDDLNEYERSLVERVLAGEWGTGPLLDLRDLRRQAEIEFACDLAVHWAHHFELDHISIEIATAFYQRLLERFSILQMAIRPKRVTPEGTEREEPYEFWQNFKRLLEKEASLLAVLGESQDEETRNKERKTRKAIADGLKGLRLAKHLGQGGSGAEQVIESAKAYLDNRKLLKKSTFSEDFEARLDSLERAVIDYERRTDASAQPIEVTFALAAVQSGFKTAGWSLGVDAPVLSSKTLRKLCDGDLGRLPSWGVRFEGVHFDGELDLSDVTMDVPLRLEKCLFSGGIGLSGARLRTLSLHGSAVRTSIDASGVVCEGQADFSEMVLGGEVILETTSIGEDVRFDKSLLNGINGLNLSVEGEVSLWRVKVHGEVTLAGGTYGGHLQLDNSEFFNPKGSAISISGSSVEGSVFLRKKALLIGKTSLQLATIRGDIDTADSFCINPGSLAIDLANSRVSGNVALGNGSLVVGAVQGTGLIAESAFSARGGTFYEPKGFALQLSASKLRAVLISGIPEKRTLVVGRIGLLEASVEFVDLRGANIHASGAVAIVGWGLKCGSFNLGDASVNGSISLADSTLRTFDLRNARLSHVDLKPNSSREDSWLSAQRPDASQHALDLSRSRISNLLDLDAAFVEGSVSLDHASAGVFREGKVLKDLDDVDLVGFSFEAFDSEGTQEPYTSARLANLKVLLARSNGGSFTPHIYEECEAVLARSGYISESIQIGIEGHKKRGRQLNPILRAVETFFFGWITGYGYRPWLVVFWLLGLWAVAFFTFLPGAAVMTHIGTAGKSEFVPLVYSLDLVLPILSLGQRSEWQVNTHLHWGYLREIVAVSTTVFGWILISLLVASFTGITRLQNRSR